MVRKQDLSVATTAACPLLSPLAELHGEEKQRQINAQANWAWAQGLKPIRGPQMPAGWVLVGRGGGGQLGMDKTSGWGGLGLVSDAVGHGCQILSGAWSTTALETWELPEPLVAGSRVGHSV